MENLELLLSKLVKPAQRAITNQNVTTIEQLASYSPQAIASWHGIGKNALAIIEKHLKEHTYW